MSTQNPLSQIRNLIHEGDLPGAVELLRQLLVNSPKLDEVVHLAGRLANLQKQIRPGTLSPSEEDVTRNRIQQALLDLVREIETTTIREERRNKFFIFQNPADREWVEKHLAPQLEHAGLPAHLDFSEHGLEDWQALSQAVADYKTTLLVFSGKFNRVEQGLITSLLNERPQKLLALRLGEAYVFEEFSDPVLLAAGESRAENFRPLLARLRSDEPPIWESLDEKCIEISAMPNSSEPLHLFGRGRELQVLDDAWAKREHRVLCFVAQGGTGKSALFNRWLADMGRDHFRGAGRVLATSFYSQGTGERVTSADQFIHFALNWFGERDFEQRSPWDKGKRLAQLVSEHRTLLILDGLEPLQEGGPVDTGKVKDPALFTLLRDLAKRNDGLCIVTSRLRLGGLERQAAGIRQEELSQVSTEAGREILKRPGSLYDKAKTMVAGSDRDLDQVVENFGNHAFALTLLREWLYRHPGHRAELAGTIPDLPDVPLEKGRHARRVIVAFEKLMREAGMRDEVRLLRFLGLFDRPVAREAIALLHSFADFSDALNSLWKRKLIYLEKQEQELLKGKPRMVDCHPLVREHYAEVFAREEPEVWQQSHAALYEYYKGLPERLYGKFLPDTLEEMEPLFLAVRHGCTGGLALTSFGDVYEPRVRRGNIHYCLRILGAITTDLTVMRGFFEIPWKMPHIEFQDQLQAFLLNFAGINLSSLLKFEESEQALSLCLKKIVQNKDWLNSAVSAANLSVLLLKESKIDMSIEYGEKSIKYAELSGNSFAKELAISTLAQAVHDSGNFDTAKKMLYHAEALQKIRKPKYRFLYSRSHFIYCQLLIDLYEFDEIIERAKYNISLHEEGWMSVNDFGLNFLALGQGYFFKSQNDALKSNSKHCIEALDESYKLIQKSGQIDSFPLVLLTRAAYHRHTQNHPAAEADLEEVLDIAEPTGMRLHLTDYHLETARLRLAQARVADARPHIAEAARLIAETGYHRRDKELEELQRAAGAR